MDPVTLALARESIRKRRKGAHDHVLVTGHRGNMQVAPENTLSSIYYCYVYGVPSVELDLSTTADGEIILMHDATLDRTTNGTGPVASATMNYIRTLDAGSWYHPDFAGEPVPTWSEVLSFAKGKFYRIYAEIKSVPDPEKLYYLTKSADMLDTVCFHGFVSRLPALRRIRELDPNCQISLISTGSNEGWNAAISYAQELRAVVVDVSWNWLRNNKHRIAEAHALGIRVDTYGIKSKTDFLEAIGAGVDGLQIDNPVDAKFVWRW